MNWKSLIAVVALGLGASCGTTEQTSSEQCGNQVDDDQDGLAESVAAHAESKLAKHKVPRYVVLHSEDFPRTPSMRVAKKQLPRQTVPDGAWDREQAAAV